MVRPVYVKHFDNQCFEQGLKECELHYQLVTAGVKQEWQWPDCPYSPGSGQYGSWTAGFHFGMPI
jgi:hypothetical protein